MAAFFCRVISFRRLGTATGYKIGRRDISSGGGFHPDAQYKYPTAELIRCRTVTQIFIVFKKNSFKFRQ
jgi:hypothetical protein